MLTQSMTTTKWGNHTQRHGSGRSDSHDDEEGRTHESHEQRGATLTVRRGETTLKDLAAARATPRTMRKAEPSCRMLRRPNKYQASDLWQQGHEAMQQVVSTKVH